MLPLSVSAMLDALHDPGTAAYKQAVQELIEFYKVHIEKDSNWTIVYTQAQSQHLKGEMLQCLSGLTFALLAFLNTCAASKDVLAAFSPAVQAIDKIELQLNGTESETREQLQLVTFAGQTACDIAWLSALGYIQHREDQAIKDVADIVMIAGSCANRWTTDAQTDKWAKIAYWQFELAERDLKAEQQSHLPALSTAKAALLHCSQPRQQKRLQLSLAYQKRKAQQQKQQQEAELAACAAHSCSHEKQLLRPAAFDPAQWQQKWQQHLASLTWDQTGIGDQQLQDMQQLAAPQPDRTHEDLNV